MTIVAELMHSQDALAKVQASLEACSETNIYHDSLAMHAVNAVRAKHPGLPTPSMEGLSDMMGSLGQAISIFWNRQLENGRELHAYRTKSQQPSYSPAGQIPVVPARIFNSRESASVLGLYGNDSYLRNGDVVIAECEKLMHAARDLLQGFKVNKIIRETTDEHPFTLRITDQALRFTSVSNYRRIFGEVVFEQYDLGLPWSSPRFTESFRTAHLMKDFRTKFAADAVEVKFTKADKVYATSKNIVEVASPEFIRLLNNIEERILELTDGKSKFEDPDFAFDDGQADTLAYLTWDSVRHVAVTLYSFSYNNATAFYNALSKVPAP